jgi:hypothetical protein
MNGGARRRAGRAGAPALLALLAALAPGPSCSNVQTVRARSYPRLEKDVPVMNKVAVAPFTVAGDLAAAARRAEIESSIGTPARAIGPTPAEAAGAVARFVAEALAAQGLDVVPAEDVALVLAGGAAGPGDAAARAPRELARVARERFGADGVVLGSVSRYRGRTGGAQEASAASVWFEVSLYTAPAGEKLWAGTFDETQRPLSQNVLVGSRYPGGGTRWLSVEELARWGAEETARSMPVGAQSAPGPKP